MMPRSIHPTIRGAMNLSTQLAVKYYAPHVAPLMSHISCTITTLTVLELNVHIYGPDKASLFWRIAFRKCCREEGSLHVTV